MATSLSYFFVFVIENVLSTTAEISLTTSAIKTEHFGRPFAINSAIVSASSTVLQNVIVEEPCGPS
jgi:hypothetical protein